MNKGLTDSEGIAISPDGTKLYVSQFVNNLNNIRVYSVNDNFNEIGSSSIADAALSTIAVHPDGTKIYVAAAAQGGAGGGVYVLDSLLNSSSKIPGIPGTRNINTVVINNDGSRVYALDIAESDIHVIDTANNTVIANIPVGTPLSNFPRGAILSSDSKVLYVADTDNNIYIIDTDTNTVVKFIDSQGTDPRGMSISPDGLKLYVGHRGTNNVAIFDISDPKNPTFIENINVPASLEHRQGNSILSF